MTNNLSFHNGYLYWNGLRCPMFTEAEARALVPQHIVIDDTENEDDE